MRTSHTRNCFLSRQIGDMDKGVVEGRKDVSNAEHQLTLSDLGPEGDGVLFLGCFNFFGGLRRTSESQHCNPSFISRF